MVKSFGTGGMGRAMTSLQGLDQMCSELPERKQDPGRPFSQLARTPSFFWSPAAAYVMGFPEGRPLKRRVRTDVRHSIRIFPAWIRQTARQAGQIPGLRWRLRG